MPTHVIFAPHRVKWISIDNHRIISRHIACRTGVPGRPQIPLPRRQLHPHPNQSARVRQARAHLAHMVRLGAYKRGTGPATDEAIRVHPRLDALLSQSRNDPTALDECFTRLSHAYAAWLPAAHLARAHLASALTAAEAATTTARAALTQARAAERAAEIIAEKRATEARRAALKQEQIKSDDRPARQPASGGRGSAS